MDRSYDVINYVSKLSNVADIIKIAIIFIKATFKESKKS